MEEDRSREDGWFRENERQLLEAARIAREKRERLRAEQEKAEERVRLRDLHFMKCPKCGHGLAEEDLGGVKIDRCTFCEGVYLDAGELDHLFARRDDERRGIFRKLLKI